MLFHTWTFLAFMAVVLPVFYALRKTRLWVPWLMVTSYVFYGWWNPYYLILIAYSTALDFVLVALMDQCPREQPKADLMAGRASPHLAKRKSSRVVPISALKSAGFNFGNRVLKVAFIVASAGALSLLLMALFGPRTLRPTAGGLAMIFFLMALGAYFGSRSLWLVISIINNLAILLFFKYARFASENLQHVFSGLHLPIHLPDPAALMPFGAAYALPVGISFFTFQSMSYTIDFYLGNVERERSFTRFATFVCFFPQLVAGPIERARNMLPQFREFPQIRIENVTDGLSLFLVGLFKKLALANYLSFYVERVYDRPSAHGAFALVMATFAFSWQILFDFSGYTDMARGVAKLMGFELRLNFNNPYLATGLGDFWTRWHISLSTWFRDYLYIPLGGNQHGTFNTYRNLFLTFLISGFWHGASWTFVIWGVLHAAGVMITRELERLAFYRDKVPRLVKQMAVFLFVSFAWIFFRAESLRDAVLIVNRIFNAAWHDPQIPALMLVLIAVIWFYQHLYESPFRNILKTSFVRVGLAVSMVLYLCLCASGGGAFIYFQF